MVLKAYRGPLLIHPSWYELPLGTFRSGGLSVAPSRTEEHDARDTISIYKDTIREYVMEFDDPYVRAQTQHEMKISDRVATYNAGDMDTVGRIDELEEQRRKWKSYYRSVLKYHAGISKLSFSKGNSSS